MFDESQASGDRDPVQLTGKFADPHWAWARFEADARRPWDLPLAGHLYRRAGFGANWKQLQQALAAGPQETIDQFFNPEADLAAFNQEYDEFEAAGSGSAESLRAWWLRRAILTPQPLLEKMTLFWHSHFAVTYAKVKSGRLMQQHVKLLRSHALGRFEPMLQAISRDPAMLIAVDTGSNRRGQPNENYARQLFGQFCLGSGNFSETDIHEATRAFTGHVVLRGELRFFNRDHDPGMKKILGQEGNFGGEDVVRIVLRHPAAPRLLVRKLYRWLISETEDPPETLIAPLAESFAKDYDVARLVETMLRSKLFFSAAAYRRRIKSPMEFALGIALPLEKLISTSQLGQDLAALGQNLCYPPTVKGWQGGRHWINRATLIGRSNLAQALFAPKGPYKGKLDPWAIANAHGHTDPAAAGQFLLDLFLQGDVDAKVRETLLKTARQSEGDPSQQLRSLARAVVTLPEFQLA